MKCSLVEKKSKYIHLSKYKKYVQIVYFSEILKRGDFLIIYFNLNALLIFKKLYHVNCGGHSNMSCYLHKMTRK